MGHGHCSQIASQLPNACWRCVHYLCWLQASFPRQQRCLFSPKTQSTLGVQLTACTARQLWQKTQTPTPPAGELLGISCRCDLLVGAGPSQTFCCHPCWWISGFYKLWLRATDPGLLCLHARGSDYCKMYVPCSQRPGIMCTEEIASESRLCDMHQHLASGGPCKAAWKQF